MAISTGGTIGAVGNAVAGTSFTAATTASLGVDKIVVVGVVADNLGTVDGVTNEHISATFAGKAMIKLGEYSNANGAAGNGVTTSLWLYINRSGSTIASAVSMIFQFSGMVTEKCSSGWKFNTSTGIVVEKDPTPATNPIGDASDASTNWPSASFSGLSSVERLYFRILGKESNTTTAHTPTSTFTAITPISSSAVATAVAIRGEFKIATSTGQTSSPVLAVSADNVGLFVAIREIVRDPTMMLKSESVFTNKPVMLKTGGVFAVRPVKVKTNGVFI